MKAIFSIILFISLIISSASAQNSLVSPPISLGVVIPPSHQTGNSNYILSLSDEDFKNNKYVFYTDSSATVAYLAINGSVVRLTGGSNPENIMAYVGNGYTITLSITKNTGAADEGNLKITATLVIYNQPGQVLVKNATGSMLNISRK